MDLTALQYPIGHFQKPAVFTAALLEDYRYAIATFPERLRTAVASLSETQLDTPYRPGGWSVRQVIHHCSDSHMNSLMRFKLALTEENPVIRPYFEDRWAELPDSHMAIEPALLLLEGLHQRWNVLLQSLETTTLQRTFIHPEQGKEITLAENMGIYAWHCNHHLAHITSLITREKW